ncbi:YchJ family protein [Oceanisphaera pacifica]|uniref:SecC motif-containing protein n=1 Tax=Oceanisphaera pacifica TaxID=2818389 RepID=A0ABS3NJA1_9GAMM|nr:YchJ family metal-binding protein [Oceanisphaera pacifica]MBO1520664.1 SecC motif-containing protein [Oceanisphaera pacifica]
MRCHCDSQQPFEHCCQPYLSGITTPSSPLALMRSRYSAFVLGLGDYLLHTWHPDTRGQLTADELSTQGQNTEWLGLTIIFATNEMTSTTSVVEFKVRYREHGRVAYLHERSNFELLSGRWLYRDGLINPPKIKLNQACPCGAAHRATPKKYKHCCAKRSV